MSGPSQQVEQAQINNANQQSSIAQQEFDQSQQDLAARDKLQAPAISLYTSLTSGDPKAQLTAAAPILGQISSGYQASKDSIFNSIAPGAGRDYALSELNVQSNAAKSGALSNVTAGAFDKLANIGSGLGAFSLQDVGASLNAYSGANTGLNNVGQQQAASKAATLGFLGDLVGGGAAVASAGITKGCWIAEAIYGEKDLRTHVVRQYLNGPFAKTRFGSRVMWLYEAVGREVAWLAKRSTILRGALRPLFDLALSAALKGH